MCDRNSSYLQKPPTFVAVAFVLILVDLAGIFGNILLIKVMSKSRSIHRSYGIYLIALAVTDSMNLLFNLITMADEFIEFHNHGHYTLHKSAWCCRIYFYIAEVFTITSAWLIICLSTERFLVMYFPVRGRVWWKSHSLAIFLIVTVVGLLTQSPRLYFMTHDSETGACMFKVENNTVMVSLIFDSTNRFLFVYAVPGFTVLILNLMIILRLYGFVRRNAPVRAQEQDQRYSAIASPPTVGHRTRSDRRRATCILLTISCTYLICMAPESIIVFYWSVVTTSWNNSFDDCELGKSFYNHFYLYRFIYSIFTGLSYGSTFFTYLIFGKRFRKEVSFLWKLSSTSSTVANDYQINAFSPLYNFQGNVHDPPGRKPRRCQSTMPRRHSDYISSFG